MSGPIFESPPEKAFHVLANGVSQAMQQVPKNRQIPFLALVALARAQMQAAALWKLDKQTAVAYPLP